MADQLEQTTQQTTNAVQGMGLNLTDLIAGMIQATIDADQAVTDDYLEKFSEYAFEPGTGGHDRLKMVDFEMTDNEGVRRLVSIPRISLLPLPVLHVSVATFDIDAKLQVEATKQTVEEEDDTSTSTSSAGTTSTGTTSTGTSSNNFRVPTPIKKRVVKEDVQQMYRAARLQLVLDTQPAATLSKNRKKEVQDTATAKQTINARIHFELRPSTLPNGMRGALQLADTSIQEIILENNKSKDAE